MRKRRLWLALLAVTVFGVVFVAVAAVRGSGPMAPDLRVVNDYAALQGTWEAVAAQTHGRAHPICEVWTFRGDRLRRSTNQRLVIEYRIEKHAIARPSWLDLRAFQGGVQLGTAAAIYRLNGEVLQVSMGGTRPQRFDTKPNGGGATLFTLKRVPLPPTPRPLSRIVS